MEADAPNARDAVVFVESNTSGTGALAIDTAVRMGLEPMLFVSEPKRYEFLESSSAQVRLVDTASVEAIMSTCRSLQGLRIVGVLSTSDYFVHAAARVAEQMRLPGPPPESVERARHKSYQYTCLQADGITVPRFVDGGDIGTLSRSLEQSEMRGPFVVKPATGSGSVGVRYCDTAEAAVKHSSSLLSSEENERGLRLEPWVLIQEYVSGQEYSVEVINDQVVAVVRKHVGRHPFFVETGHSYPCTASDDRMSRVRDIAIRTAESLNLRNTAVHLEVRCNPRGEYVIEANPRLAGGMIPRLIELAGGPDLLERLVALACARPIQRAARAPAAHGALRFFVRRRPGLVSFDPAALERDDERCEVVRYAQRLTAVALHGDFRDRVGHVICVRDTELEAERAARRVVGRAGL